LELDFHDTSYFIKFFKKQTGLTPEKFRKQYLSNG
jgi:AraC family transcriptional regulator, transcriptional activator of pobA